MSQSPIPSQPSSDQAVERLKSMSEDEYRQLISTAAPELDGGSLVPDEDLAMAGWPGRPTVELEASRSFDDAPETTLKAYLASALTGLEVTAKNYVAHLSHVVATIGAENGIEVYEPRNITDPVHHPDFKDWEVWRKDRDEVLRSDLLIHLAHYPSTGSGEELSFAYDAMVPIVVIRHSDHRVSRMVTGIPNLLFVLTYDEPEQMTEQLDGWLKSIRPILLQRRAALSGNSQNVFGSRLRALRELRGLTIDELVRASAQRVELKHHQIETWEASTDAQSNPTLVQLREVATLLGVSVAELIEPSHDDAVLSYVERYVRSQAARGSSPDHPGDTSVLQRKVLERLLRRLDS